MNNIKERFNVSKNYIYILIINIFLIFTINNRNTLIEVNVSNMKIIYKLFLLSILIFPTICFFIFILKIKNKVKDKYSRKIKNCFIEIIISIICFMIGFYFLIVFKGAYWFFDIPLILTTIIYMYSSIIEISINKYNINQVFWPYKIYFKPVVMKSNIRKNNEKEMVIHLIITSIFLTFIYTIIICFPLGYFIRFNNKTIYIVYLLIFSLQTIGCVIDLFFNQYTKIEGICTEVRSVGKSQSISCTIIDYKTERSITIWAPIGKYKIGDKVTVIHEIFSKRIIDNFFTEK